MQMLVDGVRSITLHGNVTRIHCGGVGADGQEESAGTLLIPGNEVGPVMQALVNGLQEMQKQLRERAQPPPLSRAMPEAATGARGGQRSVGDL